VLRIECPTCGRQGRYHVARLLEELGPAARLKGFAEEKEATRPTSKSGPGAIPERVLYGNQQPAIIGDGG